MRAKAQSDYYDFRPTATAASGQDESLWNAALNGRKTPAPSHAALPVQQEPEESIWGSKMRGAKPSAASTKATPPATESTGESLWSSITGGLSSGLGFSSKSSPPPAPPVEEKHVLDQVHQILALSYSARDLRGEERVKSPTMFGAVA